MATKAPEKSKSIAIDISPSVEAGEALTLRQQATALVVTNKATHTNALEFIRGAKQLKRKIETHWSNITRSVDDLKKNLLTLKRQDLEPVDEAIAQAERVSLDYERVENARVQAEADRNRREAEAKAQRERDAELNRLEEEALAAEKNSKDLSDRERQFVDYFTGPYPDAERAARAAGYKKPLDIITRLLATPKIVKAIAAAREAKTLRDQAVAKRDQPLEVETKRVESRLGKAAGVSTRTTYSCDPDVDLQTLVAAIVAGSVEYDAIDPSLVFLNRQAVALKESFEAAYPGCKLVKKSGIAG